MKNVSLLAQVLLYVSAGVAHFVYPKVFLRIMPPQLPNPDLLHKVAGAAEIVLGLALLPRKTRSLASKGIIALLVAVYPANIYQFVAGGAGLKVPQWALLARLPMQFVLMWAAWNVGQDDG